MFRNKFLLILLLTVSGSFIGLRAQDCDCYKTTRAQGVKLMQQKQYAKAIQFFDAAADCPDKPKNDDLAQKKEECRKAIQQAEDTRRQEEAEARRRQQEEAARREREAEQRRQKEAADAARREESEWAKKAYMDISYIDFGNQDKDANVISAYGAEMYAKDVKYLAPRIKYTGKCTTSKSVDLYWKITNPDGNLVRNASTSPEGYTTNGTYTVSPGSNEIRLIGWGTSGGGFYKAGYYKFELYYQGNQIWSTYVHLKGSGVVERAATIQDVTVDHNVYEDGKKGMKIHVKFNIKQCKGESCRAIAYFYYADGTSVKDTNGQYKDAGGNVSSGTDFKPGYDDTDYKDLVIFIPNAEIHSTTTTGTVSFYFQVELYNFNTKSFIGNKYKVNFSLTY